MDKLDEIMAWKRQEVAQRSRPVTDSELERLARLQRSGQRFRDALRRDSGLALISEIKRRSPSAGAIKEAADAVEQARQYYNAGTDAISVLTDEKFFQGHIRDLWEVNDLLANRPDTPPTLRKDFFVDPIQIVEAAEAGAGAILIIVRALSDDEMRRLYDAATLAGLDSLFEVHSAPELERALQMKPKIVGVNNRDLGRFVTDLAYSEELIPQIPSDIVRISESGIWNQEDAERARETGADAVLIGEALMRCDDVEAFIEMIHSVN
ncbi:MAG: indole-3-glycerol phosphate synthase [Puniceicoccaceae bacterium 5H]|nr:MAG: indole-3-glycerol phosphate synthase [Puniceicoccaceae bacterium 5H]